MKGDFGPRMMRSYKLKIKLIQFYALEFLKLKF